MKESTFQVTIEGQTHQLSTEDAEALDILPIAKGVFHVLKEEKSYEATLVSADYDKKQMTLLINGNKYELKIEDEYDLLVKQMGLSAGGSQKIKNVKAPMPGLILDILVESGQTVSKGDQLLILEAMKMENVLKAEGEGIVKTVAVQKGNTVEKGQLLIEME